MYDNYSRLLYILLLKYEVAMKQLKLSLKARQNTCLSYHNACVDFSIIIVKVQHIVKV